LRFKAKAKAKAGSWKLEAGSWKLEAGGWRLEVGGKKELSLIINN